MSDPFTKWLQSRLTAHGFAVGMVDGWLGSVTIAALKGFQQKYGLPVTGAADPATVTALRGSSSIVSLAVKAEIPYRDNPDDPAIKKIALVDQRFPRQRNVPSFYGEVGQHQASIEIPFDMVLAWDRNVRIRRITLHAKVALSAIRVFRTIAETYSAADRAALGIDVFGGSLNVRRMRGGSAFSMHSWGIAIDFDPERNALQTHAFKARLSHKEAAAFWDAWAAEGWLSLGRARDFDWMHVQAARL